MSERVSRRDLESFAFGEAIGAEAQRMIEADPALVEEVAALRAEREQFLARAPADQFVKRVLRSAERRERRRWIAPLVALAASVLLALVFRPRPEEIRSKGEPPRLVVHRSRAGGSAAPFEGPVAAGDVLRFSVTAEAPSHVALFDVDGSGAVALWVPPLPISAAKSALPGSIVLDDSPGPELLILAVSAAPIDPVHVDSWLKEQVKSAGGARVLSERLRGPPGVVFVVRLLEKQ